MKNLRLHLRLYLVAVVSGILLLTTYVVYNLLAPSGPGSFPPPWVHSAAFLLGVTTTLIAIQARPAPPEARPQAPPGYMVTVRTLASAIDAGDPLSRGRSYRLSKFCVRMGQHLGLSGLELEDLEYAALLHDIGRTAIHHDVLLKPGKLDDKERAIVRTHPQIGYDILKEILPLAGAAEIVYAHHEQPDGRGYPRGLSGKHIPQGSRIIMVAAAFDAMTSDRPYRRALLPTEALEELRDCAGTMFFPEAVDALTELYSSGALFETMNLTELEMYSSGHSVSRVIEEFLAANRTAGGEAAPAGPSNDQPSEESSLEIALPSAGTGPEEGNRKADESRGEEVA